MPNSEILFYGTMALGLTSLVYAAIARQLIYSLMGGLATLFCVAWLLIFSGAELVGVAHIVLYVGGILILFLFGVFLTARQSGQKEVPNHFRAFWTPLAVAIAMGYFLQRALLFSSHALEARVAVPLPTNKAQALGQALMTVGNPGLELVAVLLLLALLGIGYFLKISREDEQESQRLE